ncbi:MAG: 2OG-Fe(II) oxygenase [Chitinophagaceae bacterium]|nr:2OG-Fe(II) oxygenase [Chitinophagaceae bacterium]
MQKNFESLINSFLENNVGVSDHFLTPVLLRQLKVNLEKLYASDQMKRAGTGNTGAERGKLFRTDQIHWLDRKHEDEFENAFFDLMDEFIIHLNRTCYTGINGYEFHYTLYPIGSSYKRHLDQFQNNDSRKFSMIMYLNNGWKTEDGGELRIFQENYSLDISPTNGKIVFFKSSDLEHEVLKTNKARLSITGWLKS